ncbi:TRAP transporter fused permease subunit [Rhizobium sp. RU36D]|uniref:TRAP transporter permease n=1 Tax=Rhizobium sp. RU36D TaxID=1907415 RepID=UPI0009D7E072|nr:TRAP transporter fused permease subunit [Rhizobium sp. RU36D]SMC98156.1 TRAP transporter, 4TM/12TM fusion protein [Rhizobium sp. RU36D]
MMEETGAALAAETPGMTPARVAETILALAVPLLATIWILSLPQRIGLLIYPEQIVALMLGAALGVVYLRQMDKKSAMEKLRDHLLGAASVLLSLWIFLRFPTLTEGAHLHQTEALAIGVAIVLIVMDALRRVVGMTLVVIFGLIFLYALFGDWVPGALTGRPIPLGDLLRYLGTDSSATLGQTLQIAAFVVIIFVLFGGVLMSVGGGDFFTQLATRVSGNGPGNTAKVAVTASALFGSVSGSAVSNVMSTGIMTIPLMKRAGFTPAQAGGIEAVASTGGQLMPPIMGAAAFLMAEILQVPYREIALAALLPALLYYLSIYVQIDFISRRDRIGSLTDLARFPMATVLRRGWLPILAFAVLLACMFTFNMRPEVAAVWATGVMILVAMGAYAATSGRGGMTPRAVFEALVDTGRSTGDVLLITAAAGMIIGLLSITGLGFTLSMYLLDFGGKTMLGLLIITALVGIVLGLGLPTTGVYLLMASLAAPSLVELGIEPLAAHMFVFYFGILSMITPPIAMATFAAASIAGASQGRTDWEAFRFGWISYILPFLFIYKPALLLVGAPWEVAYVAVSSVVALVLVTGGLVGHALRPLSLPLRVVWTITGLATIAPLHTTELGYWLEGGIALLGLVLVVMAFAGPVLMKRTEAGR